MCAENFLKNSNLCLHPLLELLKLCNLPVTQKLVKKVIKNLDLAKITGPNCIPLVVLKNSESELSYTLAVLFNICLKESCNSDCWKILSVVLVFTNVGEWSAAKNYHGVGLFSAVSNIFEKLVINSLVDRPNKFALFSDF